MERVLKVIKRVTLILSGLFFLSTSVLLISKDRGIDENFMPLSIALMYIVTLFAFTSLVLSVIVVVKNKTSK